MDDIEGFAVRQTPTVGRPLLGTTVLVVEDSRFACEAIRLMCLRSGARLRRADCLRSAARHLRAHRPTVAIVDLGLPDGSGLGLIGELAGSGPQRPVVIAISGDATLAQKASAAGADTFLAKPLLSLAAFQEAVLRHLPPEARPPGPRPVSTEEVLPDPMAMRDDLTHVIRILDGRPDGRALDYVAQFVGGVAISARDRTLLNAARGLNLANPVPGERSEALSRLNSVIRARLVASAAV